MCHVLQTIAPAWCSVFCMVSCWSVPSVQALAMPQCAMQSTTAICHSSRCCAKQCCTCCSLPHWHCSRMVKYKVALKCLGLAAVFWSHFYTVSSLLGSSISASLAIQLPLCHTVFQAFHAQLWNVSFKLSQKGLSRHEVPWKKIG